MKFDKSLKITSLLIIIIILIAFGNCSSDESIDPTPEPTPEPTNQIPTVTLTNVVSNDDTNIVSGNFVATDNDGTINQKTLQAEASDGSLLNITLNSDGTFSQTLTGEGKIYNKLIANAKDNDNASATEFTKQLNPTITVETPNTAPTIAVTLNNIDENTAIGSVVGNVVGTDTDGDTLTYSITEGADKFELDGTNIKTKIAFDYEDGQNTHTLKVEVSDGTDTAEETKTSNENDLTEFISDDALDSPHLSKSFAKYDVADNNPTNQTIEDRELDHNGNLTGRTRQNVIDDMADNQWPAGEGGNLSLVLTAVKQIIKDTNGNLIVTSIATGGPTGDGEVIRANFTDVDGFNQTTDALDGPAYVDGLVEIKEILTDAGYPIPGADAWYQGYNTATTEQARYTLANYLYGDQIARERATGELEDVNPDMVRKVVNTILIMNVTQIHNLLVEIGTNGYNTTQI